MLIDSGAVEADDVVLIGARNLDPPEEEFIGSHGIRLGEEGIEGRSRVCRARMSPSTRTSSSRRSWRSSCPSRAGSPSPTGSGFWPGSLAGTNVLGAGFTGATFEPGNVPPLARLATALGL